MSRPASGPSPWSLLQVEGDDHSDSDDELAGSTDSLASPSAILSPASKRARKRQAAARNKKLAKEAKEGGKDGMPTTPGQSSNAASSTKASANGFNGSTAPAAPSSSAKAGQPSAAPPTVLKPADVVQPQLDETFIQAAGKAPAPTSASEPSASGSSAGPAAEGHLAPPPTFARTNTSESRIDNDDVVSVASTEEEEDVSLLIDEESSSSDDDAEVSALLSEPNTPRARTEKRFDSKKQDQGQDGIDSNVSDVVEAVADKKEEVSQDGSKALAPGTQNYGTDHDPNQKLKAIMTRTIWTLIMIAGFIGIVLAGHVYLIILVIACQAAVFKEISALFDVAAKPVHHHHHSRSNSMSEQKAKSPTRVARDLRVKAERERWSKVTSWYFFAATNYFLHGETIIYYFKHIVFVDAYFIPFARHHRFISFMLYVLGFVGFVTNLKRNQLRRQFGLFCWIHMSLLLIVVSSHFIVNNILEGIIWFWVPASLVVMNDIAAYVWGMLFGRTQLIKLSPKKTVEGFVGAAITTVVFGYVWATIFMRFPYMVCPASDLGTTGFSEISCVPNSCFEWRSFVLPEHVSTVLSALTNLRIVQIPWAPFQLHAVIMAVFASLVAPFGGFFASGFKRAFNVKDFGDSIPGHGGMTDRMDCQFLMGLFAYVYYSSMVRDNHVTVGSVMQTVVSSLSTQDQIELAKALHGYLAQQGVSWK